MKKHITLSTILAASLFGAGYTNPNNSINSSSLCTANIANASGADSAYYNPANMVHNSEKQEIEIALSYVTLSPIKYDSSDGNYHIESKKFNAFIPSLHYTSGELSESGIRLGLSIVSPAGLSREWEDFPAAPSARKFALQTLEVNPSIAIPIGSQFSIGAGVRYMKAYAQAQLDGSMLGASAYTVDMKSEANAYGYNLALAYQYNKALNLSVTYRSEIILNLKGDADVTLGGNPFSSDGTLEVPIPANLLLGAAYTFETQTTLEIVYDRTMWSARKETNFEYSNPIVEANLGATQVNNWHDTVTYRVGLTQKFDNSKLMAGFAYGSNAADDKYVTYSSPESNAYAVSLGGRYDVSEMFDVGLAMLYNKNESRTLSQPTNQLGVNGTLSDKSAYTITIGAGVKF